MTSRIVLALVTCTLTAWGARAAASPLEQAACFGPHMVLQRDMPVPVWGTAAAGATVKVVVGPVAGEAQADASGRWRAVLPPQQATAIPQTLVIRSGDERIECEDVLVGDVWLCAGQSNMALPLHKVTGAERRLATADRRLLRLLQLEATAAGDPGERYPIPRLSAERPRAACGSHPPGPLSDMLSTSRRLVESPH
ncbi:MAG: hypothetical protein ACKOTB_14800, partial [Planctomycetia bacterium]